MELKPLDLEKIKSKQIDKLKLNEIILPNETKNLQNLKEIFGYFNNQVFEEFSGFLNQKTINYCEHFIEFTQNQSHEVSQIWAEKFSHLTDQLSLMQNVQ